MPGKVVRVLVAAGDTVEAGQGIAGRRSHEDAERNSRAQGGKVERVFVSEGQAVNAGEPLRGCNV